MNPHTDIVPPETVWDSFARGINSLNQVAGYAQRDSPHREVSERPRGQTAAFVQSAHERTYAAAECTS
jgi:hypothetical protein